MGHPASTGITPDDFLAWESTQPDKHEYFRGQIFAMVGASRKHVDVAMNVAFALRTRLEGSPCRVYMSDMKVRVEAADAIFYPDVFVTCDEADLRADQVMTAPTVIVEVLSESTAGYDRGEKFAAYRKLASLKEYMLIDPERRTIDLFRRGADELWVLIKTGGGQAVTLASLGLEVPYAEVFRLVE